VRVTNEEIEKLREEGKQESRYYVTERNNFQLADGLVFVSDTMADVTRWEYDLEQPHIVLHSYAPKEFITHESQDWWGGLVYEGKVNLPQEIERDNSFGFRYCDYSQLAKDLKRLDIGFHMYGPPSDDENYQKVYGENAFLHGRFPYEKLLELISRHDWGLMGNVYPTPHWNSTMPNKVFDYMAAGVPTVAINAKETGDFITKHDIGISVDSLEELKDRWGEERRCRKNLIKKRQQFVMDNHISKLEDLYRQFV
jgi:hypothetical protein